MLYYLLLVVLICIVMLETPREDTIYAITRPVHVSTILTQGAYASRMGHTVPSPTDLTT